MSAAAPRSRPSRLHPLTLQHRATLTLQAQDGAQHQGGTGEAGDHQAETGRDAGEAASGGASGGGGVVVDLVLSTTTGHVSAN